MNATASEIVLKHTLAECIKRGEELQAENAALIGIVEKATAAVQRIQELRDEWSRDDAESLTRFGHHMPIALGAAAEMLTRAIDGGAE